MNYKKIIASILALSMVISVVTNAKNTPFSNFLDLPSIVDAVDNENNTSNFKVDTDYINLAVGGTHTINAFGDSSAISSVTSSDKKVATVTNDGVVTAIGVGTATITLKDADDNTI